MVHALGEEPVGGREEVDLGAGKGVLALAAQARAHRDVAGAPVGLAVDAQVAGGAVPVEAEGAARAVVLRRAAERADARGVQRHGDGLALEGADGVALEVEGQRRAARRARGQGLGGRRSPAVTVPARGARAAERAQQILDDIERQRMHRRLLPLASVCFFCLAGRPAARAAAPAVPVPSAAAGAPVPGPPDAPRLAFDEAIRRALARNPTVAVALAEFRRADALVQEARAGFYPSLVGNGSYTRLEHDRPPNGPAVLKRRSALRQPHAHGPARRAARLDGAAPRRGLATHRRGERR